MSRFKIIILVIELVDEVEGKIMFINFLENIDVYNLSKYREISKLGWHAHDETLYLQSQFQMLQPMHSVSLPKVELTAVF